MWILSEWTIIKGKSQLEYELMNVRDQWFENN